MELRERVCAGNTVRRVWVTGSGLCLLQFPGGVWDVGVRAPRAAPGAIGTTLLPPLYLEQNVGPEGILAPPCNCIIPAINYREQVFYFLIKAS